jgi:FkbM family methyltransferase
MLLCVVASVRDVLLAASPTAPKSFKQRVLEAHLIGVTGMPESKRTWKFPRRHLSRGRPKSRVRWRFPRRFREDLDVGTVFDVGVAGGTPQLYRAFPGSYYVLIEPLREHVADLDAILQQHAGEYVLGAAGAETGAAIINVEPNRRAKSSLLHRTKSTTTGDHLEQRQVPVITLDEIAGSRDLAKPYGIKIDTEGFELEVVRGAGQVLKDTAFVIAEVSTSPRFEGGYQAADLLGELRKHGFVPFDILRSTRRFVDALFMRYDLAAHRSQTASSATSRG